MRRNYWRSPTGFKRMAMNELLEKAEHDLGFVIDGLKEALYKSDPVEAIILLTLLRQTRETLDSVTEFRGARLIIKNCSLGEKP